MIHKLFAHQIRDLFLSGELSAEEIVLQTLARIEKHNGQLNAFLSIFNLRALEKAKQLDQKRREKRPLGKLAGIPIAIKDNIHIKGQITSCASKFLANYTAPFDATAVRLLEEADALLIGKTNMDEFAMGGSGTHSAYGATKNPWDLTCTPGGSSSGSSATVSARLCPVALGTDTGGSIRQPAGFTGITGFKPSYGRVSRYGLVAFGSSLDQIGPMTYSTKDAALIMDVIGKHCPHDSTSLMEPTTSYLLEIEGAIAHTKIGVPWKFLEKLKGEPRQNFEAAIDVFKQLGVEIVDVDLSILKYGIAVYYILATAEASTNLARFDGIRYGVRSKNANTLDEIYENSREEGFGWEVKNRILLGTYVLASGHEGTYYTKAQKVRALIQQKMEESFQKCSVIALPVSPSTAYVIGEIKDPIEEYLQDLYTVGANLAGLPAISVPSGLSQSNQRPFGFQLMGPRTQDATVLRYAHAFQKATKFTYLMAPGFEE